MCKVYFTSNFWFVEFFYLEGIEPKDYPAIPHALILSCPLRVEKAQITHFVLFFIAFSSNFNGPLKD